MALTINETTTWQEITQGLQIYEPATSKEFLTGEWRTSTPALRALLSGQFDSGQG